MQSGNVSTGFKGKRLESPCHVQKLSEFAHVFFGALLSTACAVSGKKNARSPFIILKYDIMISLFVTKGVNQQFHYFI